MQVHSFGHLSFFDEARRIVMFRTDMNKMNIQPIDLDNELRERIQFRLDLAPVVVPCPTAREGLTRRELRLLRCIRDVAFMRLRNSVSFDSGTFK
jgi:hypothetical protein